MVNRLFQLQRYLESVHSMSKALKEKIKMLEALLASSIQSEKKYKEIFRIQKIEIEELKEKIYQLEFDVAYFKHLDKRR